MLPFARFQSEVSFSDHYHLQLFVYSLKPRLELSQSACIRYEATGSYLSLQDKASLVNNLNI
jgi:hypothetical protein